MLKHSSKSNSSLTWVRSFGDSKEQLQKLHKRTLVYIVLSQVLGGAGLAAGITVGALLAKDMLGNENFAGVPTALFTLGSAGSAFLIGRFSDKFGRRLGLATGYILGGFGAFGVVLSAVTDSIIMLFLALLVYGAGTATNLQARYAGTDLANSKQKATAISITLLSTTLGAIAGPNLVDIMGEFATNIGIPSLAGPFILAAVAYLLSGLLLFVLLRPDPLIVSKAIKNAKNINEDDVRSHISVNKHGILVGTIVMVISQIVMVAIMTMTPVHMKRFGYELNDVGLIISIHVAAMYLPSLVTGILVDRIGRTFMVVASGITLLFSGVLAAIAPTDSMLVLTISLALLGLGWNFGLISGTALIVDSTSDSNRAKTQGSVDVLIALAGAFGGILSGLIVANASYSILSLSAGFLSVLLIPLVLWFRKPVLH